MLPRRIGKNFIDYLRQRLTNGGWYNIRLSSGLQYRATFFLKTKVDPAHFISEEKYIAYEDVVAIQETERPNAAWNSPSNYNPLLAHPETSNPCGEQPL